MGEWWEPEISSIEERVGKMFEELVAELPSGCATLTVSLAREAYNDLEAGGLVFQLTPSNKSAAPIRLHAENKNIHVYMRLGRSALHEVYPTGRKSVIGQIREMCEAVVAGHLEEKLWFVDSEIAKCDATITIRGKRRRLYWFGGFYWFRKRTFKHIRYEPYVVGKSAEAAELASSR